MRRDLTLRRAAALAEFADLGLTGFDAAIMLDVSPSYVCALRKEFGIEFKKKVPRQTWAYRSVARLRSMRVPNWAIAERLSTTAASVASMAYQMRGDCAQ